MDYNPFISTEIQFMTKEMLEDELSKLNDMNLVLILTESAATRFGFYNLINRMDCKNNLVWIKDFQPNPTQADILESCKAIQLKNVDLIIAIGGGSAIDLAKGISTFYGEDPLSTEVITRKSEDKSYRNKKHFIDILAVPTTAGTGSEITGWATIWDAEKKEKFSIDCKELKPKKAFIIPELTLTLSKKLTLSTGLDALSHAVEAYWSRHTSPLVQDIAIRSIQLIIDNLKKVLDEPYDINCRECMCRASLLAAIAFSHTRTTACHSISYPMTMLYGVPHGFAVALTLNEVANKNKGLFPNDSQLFDLFMPYGGIGAWLDYVSDGIIKLRLSGFGITINDIDIIADKAFTPGRMDNNPAVLKIEDIREILLNIK